MNMTDSDGDTALMTAVCLGDLDSTELLISTGADVNKANVNGTTALMLAAWNGSGECLKLLCLHGSHVNASDIKGRTALMLAAAKGYEDCAMQLISAGADVNHSDRNGVSVLTCAAENGGQGILRVLSESPLDVLDSSADMPVDGSIECEQINCVDQYEVWNNLSCTEQERNCSSTEETLVDSETPEETSNDTDKGGSG